MAPTIKEVSARAGVSSATGSLVLSGKSRGRVSPVTADRVRSAARELGYRSPPRPPGVGPIGLITADVASDPTIQASLDAVWEAAQRRDLEVLATAVADRAALKVGLRRLAEFNVAGMLILAGTGSPVHLPRVLRRPVVLVDATSDHPDVDSVVPDDGLGQYAALATLADAGHHRVGWIGHRLPGLTEQQAAAAFMAATVEFGWDDDPTRRVLIDDVDVTDGFEAIEQMLTRYQDVTAVVCCSDSVAMSVYLTCERRGIRIPAALSVVSLEQHPLMSHTFRPPLSTVSSPRRELGSWAVARLVDRIHASRGLSPVQVRLPSTPVVGKSVAPPRTRR